MIAFDMSLFFQLSLTGSLREATNPSWIFGPSHRKINSKKKHLQACLVPPDGILDLTAKRVN
jgi:hypothetical protein